MKTVKVNARIEIDLKEQAEKILNEIGLNASWAIRSFYKQIVLHQGLPFELKIPNAETLQVIEDIEKGKNLVGYNDVEEMFRDLDN